MSSILLDSSSSDIMGDYD